MSLMLIPRAIFSLKDNSGPDYFLSNSNCEKFLNMTIINLKTFIEKIVYQIFSFNIFRQKQTKNKKQSASVFVMQFFLSLITPLILAINFTRRERSNNFCINCAAKPQKKINY